MRSTFKGIILFSKIIPFLGPRSIPPHLNRKSNYESEISVFDRQGQFCRWFILMIHKLWRIDFQIEFWVICKTKKASLASIREEKAKSQKRSSTETFYFENLEFYDTNRIVRSWISYDLCIQMIKVQKYPWIFGSEIFNTVWTIFRSSFVENLAIVSLYDLELKVWSFIERTIQVNPKNKRLLRSQNKMK